MNREIRYVLKKLNQNGYEAYIVGGYVRDFLRNQKSSDVDICTNALPKDVHKIFKCASKMGEYGSFRFQKKRFQFDITTFRKELKYQNRKPIQIEYVTELLEDLKRRDFTINALYQNKDEDIIDPLNVLEDIKKKNLKMIGNPTQRVKEDPLRILRAIRFATILDFTIDASFQEVIRKNAHLTQTISKYRIKEEYSKILSSPNYQKGLDLSEELGLTKYLFIEYNNVYYSPNIYEMWAQVKIKDIPFTKQEKRTIIRIKETIKKK